MLYDLSIGPFSFNIHTTCPSVSENFERLYQDFDRQPLTEEFTDFLVSVDHAKGLRRWLKPQVSFYHDGFAPFYPLPLSQAYAMLEWGMNWCITNHALHFLILHAAVIEKNGIGIVLPAPSGSGKSTLCAAMAYTDWRLFSDELALISLRDGLLYPCTRPINLKNDSIAILNDYVSNAVFSSLAKDTKKGTVALLKPPKDSVAKIDIPARSGAIVFPKYNKNSPARLKPLDKLEAFPLLIENSFNYHTLGVKGFRAVSSLLKSSAVYTLEYNRFEEANKLLTALVSK